MTENNITNKLLTAALGYLIANKDETVFANMVYLAAGDSADNYHEVTIEYANSRVAEGGERYTPGTLSEAKAQKIAEINAADEASNSFTANSVQMWIDKETRTSLMSNTLPALKAAGEKTTKLWGEENGVPVSFEVNIDTMLNVMLPALELYCKATYDLCMQHKATVLAMSDIESVQAFDAAAGYPGKLKF